MFRQSPPIWCFSMSVTLAFTAAPIRAVTRPAEPAPMTTRLRSKRAGLTAAQRAYTLRALTASTILLAISGKMPSSAKAPISPGDRMPDGDSIAASCVPAFT